MVALYFLLSCSVTSMVGFGDDVIIGENVSFFVDDESGALAFLLAPDREKNRRSWTA